MKFFLGLLLFFGGVYSLHAAEPESIPGPTTPKAAAPLVGNPAAELPAVVGPGKTPLKEVTIETKEQAEARKQAEEDARVKARGSLFLVPAPFYSPETSVGLNLLLFKVFAFNEEKNSTDSSNILSYLTYTAKEQVAFSVTPTYYWNRGDDLFTGEIGYKSWPDEYFGIGNATSNNFENYAVQMLYLRPRVYHKLFSQWSAGPFYELEDDVIIESTQGGLIAGGSVPGTPATFQSGVGLALRYDSRDIIFFPTQGFLFDSSLTDFTALLGSQSAYYRFTADAHRYFEIAAKNILALELYFRSTTGNVPFESMSLLGGNQYMRGIYQGRFRDKDYILGQAEYRFPIYKRLSAAAFGSMGEVSDQITDFTSNCVQSAAGGGLRFTLNRQQQLNVRVDYGVAPYSSGLYIAVGEAL